MTGDAGRKMRKGKEYSQYSLAASEGKNGFLEGAVSTNQNVTRKVSKRTVS